MATVSLARNAMATRFEVVLHGDCAMRLRAAGEEALAEIERLEAQLSLFRPSSEVAHLNARASKESVQVTPLLFSLLEQAQRLTLETDGAFDITIAPLVRCWGFHSGAGRRPAEQELRQIGASVGMHNVLLDRNHFAVRFASPGTMIDLGAIGKGFAIDQAVELLREAGVTSGLIHGGTSTVFAIGSPPGESHWTIGLPLPEREPNRQVLSSTAVPPDHPLYTLAGAGDKPRTVKIPIKDEALSVSAIWGRFFEDGGETLGHIVDPRTGRPAQTATLAAIALPCATESDALSTALLILGHNGHSRVASLRPGIRTLVGTGAGDGFRAISQGIPWESTV